MGGSEPVTSDAQARRAREALGHWLAVEITRRSGLSSGPVSTIADVVATRLLDELLDRAQRLGAVRIEAGRVSFTDERG